MVLCYAIAGPFRNPFSRSRSDRETLTSTLRKTGRMRELMFSAAGNGWRNLCTTGAQSSKIRAFCGADFSPQYGPVRIPDSAWEPCPNPLANHADCSVTWEEGLWRRCRIEVSQYPCGYQWRSTGSLLSDGARSHQSISYCHVLDAQIKNGSLPSEVTTIGCR
jgi:hypothetical protein